MPAGPKAIHVHAGRHKTGTSAIQLFLSRNRDTLGEAGFHYPCTGCFPGPQAHHGVALALAGVRRTLPAKASQRFLRSFRHEIDSCGKLAIASSERFQTVAPRRLANYLRGWQVYPVIYVRDHLHYLVASYQQIVHARTTTIDLENFYELHFKHLSYAGMLDEWVSVFGTGNVSLRIYDRATLACGDVVEDFVRHVTGRPATDFGELPGTSINPGLGEPLLAFKRAINVHLDHEAQQQRILYAPLSRLASSRPEWSAKPALTADLVERVGTNARGDMERLLRCHWPRGRKPFSHDWANIADTLDWPYDGGEIMSELTKLSPRAAAYIRSKVPKALLFKRG